jgi:4-aminobutyrate aminotransferase-like enzyme
MFLANSGVKANDGAIKMSLKHTTATGKENLGVFAFEQSFHGRLSEHDPGQGRSGTDD